MTLLIFGGSTYYPSGGGNDFICNAEASIAQLIAYNLIGTKIKFIDKWEDEVFDETIEWTNIITKEGIILHTFGRPFGPPLGVKRVIKYLEDINYGNDENLRLGILKGAI